jgi:XapX domain-containing protein
MMMVASSLLTGITVGLLFSFFKFPIPAPPTFAGIAGIIGIWLGMIIMVWFRS